LGGDDVFVIYGPIPSDMDLIDADVDLQGPDGSYTGHGSISATSRATGSETP
jgi:hypothetical protein